MKTQLQAKLLRHFAKKNKTGGFTLIELLVVIIIIGILSAIALPAFLNQANKARQSEAKTYVGSMNRAQQAYYLENGSFALNGGTGEPTAIEKLGVGIPDQTDYYTYDVAAVTGSDNLVTNQAVPEEDSVKAYVGGVEQTSNTTLAVLCEETDASLASDTGATGTESIAAGPGCPAGNNYDQLGR